MKLKDVFRIIQGHQITDEEIYKSIGNIPIYTASNEIKGYWNKIIVNQDDLPCISYPTKANKGEAFIQKGLFDANNTAVLIPLPHWRNQIVLEWAALKLAAIFLKIATSKEGVSYLNKEIVEEIEFEVPKEAIQHSEMEILGKVLLLNAGLNSISNRIDKTYNSSLQIEYKNYQAQGVIADDIFSVISGNYGLTEEYLYPIMYANNGKIYRLLTGSTDITDNLLIPRCLRPGRPGTLITVYEGEGIHVVRKGKAGHINYLPYGKYTVTDDAYILKTRNDCKLDISLRWIVAIYRMLFIEFASKSDNGTWNKTGFLKHTKFDIPCIEEQDAIINIINRLEFISDKIGEPQKRLQSILKKELV